MSLSGDRSTVARINKEIGDLRTKEASEVRKAADAQRRINSALESARKASSTSSATSYLGTADRESRTLQSALENQSRYASQAANKYEEVARLQERIFKEEESERRKTIADQEKLRRDEEYRRKAELERQKRADAATASTARAMQQRIEDVEAQLKQQLEERAGATATFSLVTPYGESETYDVFISHATEDKIGFVDGLAAAAQVAGLRVWYDKFAIEWGDSLRQKIDLGLASSYFGIAVLSPHFFAKPWPQYELDALVDRGLSGTGRLLPIWHNISKDEVRRHSPALSGRLALSTAFMSTGEIVDELLKLRDRYRSNAE